MSNVYVKILERLRINGAATKSQTYAAAVKLIRFQHFNVYHKNGLHHHLKNQLLKLWYLGDIKQFNKIIYAGYRAHILFDICPTWLCQGIAKGLRRWSNQFEDDMIPFLQYINNERANEGKGKHLIILRNQDSVVTAEKERLRYVKSYKDTTYYGRNQYIELIQKEVKKLWDEHDLPRGSTITVISSHSFQANSIGNLNSSDEKYDHLETAMYTWIAPEHCSLTEGDQNGTNYKSSYENCAGMKNRCYSQCRGDNKLKPSERLLVPWGRNGLHRTAYHNVIIQPTNTSVEMYQNRTHQWGGICPINSNEVAPFIHIISIILNMDFIEKQALEILDYIDTYKQQHNRVPSSMNINFSTKIAAFKKTFNDGYNKQIKLIYFKEMAYKPGDECDHLDIHYIDCDGKELAEWDNAEVRQMARVWDPIRMGSRPKTTTTTTKSKKKNKYKPYIPKKRRKRLEKQKEKRLGSIPSIIFKKIAKRNVLLTKM